jgi:hypothetical protein
MELQGIDKPRVSKRGGSYLKLVSLIYRIFRKRDSEVTRQFLEAAVSTPVKHCYLDIPTRPSTWL